MNAVSRNPFVKGAEVANFLVTNTEALSKVSSVAVAVLSFLGTVFSQFVPGSGATIELLSNLKKGPEAIKVFTSATGIVQRAYEFTDSKERSAISKTPQKLLGRVTLTAAQALDTVSFLDSISVVEIGALGASFIGNLSFLSFVKNALITVSSLFCIWDSAKTIHAEKQPGTRSKVKLQDWTAKDPNAVRLHIQARQHKYDQRIEADAQIYAKKLDDFKNYKIERYNAKINNVIKKGWVSIAADVSKLAIVVLSSIALMFLLASPISLLVVGATAIVASSIGLAKTLYGEYGAKLPQNTLIKVA